MPTPAAIKAGEAFVHLRMDNTAFVRGLRAAQRQLHNFGSAIRQISGRVLIFGGAMTGALALVTRRFMTLGDSIAKMSERTGISIETLSGLRYAFELSGSTLEEFEDAFRRFQVELFQLSRGDGPIPAYLQQLNIMRLVHLRGEDQLLALAESFRQIRSPIERAAIAVELFGRSGTALLPFLMQGAAGIRRVVEEARRLGIVLPGAVAGRAVVLQDSLSRLRLQLESLGNIIAASLVPLLDNLVNFLSKNLVPIQDWITRNVHLIDLFVRLTTAVMIANSAFWIFGTFLSNIGTVLGFVIGGASSLVAILNVLVKVGRFSLGSLFLPFIPILGSVGKGLKNLGRDFLFFVSRIFSKDILLAFRKIAESFCLFGVPLKAMFKGIISFFTTSPILDMLAISFLGFVNFAEEQLKNLKSVVFRNFIKVFISLYSWLLNTIYKIKDEGFFSVFIKPIIKSVKTFISVLKSIIPFSLKVGQRFKSIFVKIGAGISILITNILSNASKVIFATYKLIRPLRSLAFATKGFKYFLAVTLESIITLLTGVVTVFLSTLKILVIFTLKSFAVALKGIVPLFIFFLPYIVTIGAAVGAVYLAFKLLKSIFVTIAEVIKNVLGAALAWLGKHFERLKATVLGIKDDIVYAYSGIAVAIRMNDWKAATEIALMTVKVIWARFKEWIFGIYDDIFSAWTNMYYKIASWMLKFMGIMQKVKAIFTTETWEEINKQTMDALDVLEEMRSQAAKSDRTREAAREREALQEELKKLVEGAKNREIEDRKKKAQEEYQLKRIEAAKQVAEALKERGLDEEMIKKWLEYLRLPEPPPPEPTQTQRRFAELEKQLTEAGTQPETRKALLTLLERLTKEEEERQKRIAREEEERQRAAERADILKNLASQLKGEGLEEEEIKKILGQLGFVLPDISKWAEFREQLRQLGTPEERIKEIIGQIEAIQQVKGPQEELKDWAVGTFSPFVAGQLGERRIEEHLKDINENTREMRRKLPPRFRR